mgnify:CR=1 FL=1
MDTIIKDAKSEDIEVIQELNTRLSEKEAEEFDPTIDPEWISTEEAFKHYKQRIQEKDGFAKKVEHNEQVVGYAIGGIHGSESYREDLKIAELETMYILPEYRSNGIGTELVENFTTWAEKEDADRLRVEATAQNEDAIRFYRENGFKDYALTLEREL